MSSPNLPPTMPDFASPEFDANDATLAPWLTELGSDAPCGSNLEYENTFLALTQAAAGKPETQFSAAEPPDWPQVQQLAEELNGNSHDLRIAMLWLRARLRREGLVVLAPTLQLMRVWLSRWWEHLHPELDDGDAYARMNVLGELSSLNATLGDVRMAWVLNDRSIGAISVRDIEIALGQLLPRDDESPMSRSQIEAMLSDGAAKNPAIGSQAKDALAALESLSECLSAERDAGGAGVSYGDLPDFSNLRQTLEAVAQVLPSADASAGDLDALLGSLQDDSGAASASVAVGGGRGRGGSSGTGAIESRQDAVQAIERVCAYLERNEPTNPACQLLRRAQRLIDSNFLQLVREFAPEAVGEVARMLGVDPSTLENY
ncbi:MAG: ImpA family type VI secretion system protein [Inhella sp.]